MSVKIIPTVLASSKEEFDQRLQKLLPVADEIQVDIMDGQFVPSRSVAINDIPDMKAYPNRRFEAHLMVQTPGAHIQPMARRGFARIIFHIEAVEDKFIPALLEQCAKYNLRPVLAINPETPVERLLPYAFKVDGVLFLGVHPGFNGAPYVPETAARIRKFVKLNPNKQLLIQVDGGMTAETIGHVVAAGATRINSGSFVSNAPDAGLALKSLEVAAERALELANMRHTKSAKKSSKRSTAPSKRAKNATPKGAAKRPPRNSRKPTKTSRNAMVSSARKATKKAAKQSQSNRSSTKAVTKKKKV